MINTFESLIKGLKALMDKLNNDEGESNPGLLSLLKAPGTVLVTSSGSNLAPNSGLSSSGLKDILFALLSQHNYTSSTSNLLPGNGTTLEALTNAVNLIQIYFQVTKPLEQILTELADNLEDLDPKGSAPNKLPPNIEDIKNSIRTIILDRKNLQKEQNKILREFEGEIDEQELQDLLQRSSDILAELQGFTPPGDKLDQLLQDIEDFIRHLQKAQELFKTFRQQGEAIRDSEAGEVEQLIRNWRDAIKEIERLELNDDIKEQLNKLPDKSKQAIAQSIQIHELLEANYGFLSDLIRSGDLVSPGVL